MNTLLHNLVELTLLKRKDIDISENISLAIEHICQYVSNDPDNYLSILLGYFTWIAFYNREHIDDIYAFLSNESVIRRCKIVEKDRIIQIRENRNLKVGDVFDLLEIAQYYENPLEFLELEYKILTKLYGIDSLQVQQNQQVKNILNNISFDFNF